MVQSNSEYQPDPVTMVSYHRALAEHADSLKAYASRLLGDPIAAEDVAQDAFLALYRHLNQVPTAAFRPWLFRVARNLCLAQLRDVHGFDNVHQAVQARLARRTGHRYGFVGPNGKGKYVPSDKSFLFSLFNAGRPPIKFEITKKLFAVSHHPDCGPVFGAGADLFICHACDQVADSYSNLPHSYDGQVGENTLLSV